MDIGMAMGMGMGSGMDAKGMQNGSKLLEQIRKKTEQGKQPMDEALSKLPEKDQKALAKYINTFAEPPDKLKALLPKEETQKWTTNGADDCALRQIENKQKGRTNYNDTSGQSSTSLDMTA